MTWVQVIHFLNHWIYVDLRSNEKKKKLINAYSD